MRNLFNNVISRANILLTLIVTGAPGFQRLAFITIASLYYTTAQVGIIASDLGISTFIAIASGGAVSGQLLALWAKHSDIRSRRLLGKHSLYWQLGITIASVAIVLALYAIKLTHSPGAILVFAVGFSLWQIERTKLISDKKLHSLAALEITLLTSIATTPLIATTASNLLLLYGALLLFAGFCGILLTAPREKTTDGATQHKCNGLGFRHTLSQATSGLLSSGRESLTIPAIKIISNDSIAGVVAQVMVVTASLLLLPRALANSYIPEISRLSAGDTREEAASLKTTVDQYKANMRKTIITITLLLVATLVTLGLLGWPKEYIIISLFSGLALVAGQLSLLPSTLLNVKQNLSPVLFSSAIFFAVWTIFIVGLYFIKFDALFAVVVIMIISIIAAVTRAIYLSNRANA